MINLKRNQNNDVIFTLTEKETTYSGTYKMKLTNSQSNEVIYDIILSDISTHINRYNEFYIMLSTLHNEFEVTTNTTLEENAMYFISGDIIVEEGVTLRIPVSSYIIKASDSDIINSGIIINEGNIVEDMNITPQTKTFTEANVTYIFDLLSGYYEYEITSVDNNTTLEIGKILVGPDPDRPGSTYTPTENTYIYND